MEDNGILAPEIQDRTLCQVAAEASCETKPLLPISVTDQLFIVDEEWAPRVMRGLARISLQPPGSDYSGVSQAKADYIIGELSGDVEDFFYPVLYKATQN